MVKSSFVRGVYFHYVLRSCGHARLINRYMFVGVNVYISSQVLVAEDAMMP